MVAKYPCFIPPLGGTGLTLGGGGGYKGDRGGYTNGAPGKCVAQWPTAPNSPIPDGDEAALLGACPGLPGSARDGAGEWMSAVPEAAGPAPAALHRLQHAI